MKYLLLGLLGVAQARERLLSGSAGTLEWNVDDGNGGVTVHDAPCPLSDDAVHAAMCGRALSSGSGPSLVNCHGYDSNSTGCQLQSAAGCNWLGEGDDGACHCDGAGCTTDHSDPSGPSGPPCTDGDVTNSLCGEINGVKRVGVKTETCTAGNMVVSDETGCKALSDLTGTDKQAARKALKNGMPDEGKKLKEVSYTNVAERKSAQQAAKTARRDYLAPHRVNGADWKDLVIEDDADFVGYTDKVLAKRAKGTLRPARKINYRLAPFGLADAGGCLDTDADLELEVGGIESIDLEVDACVSVKVAGESDIVTVEDSDGSLKIKCNDALSVDVQDGDIFSCGGRMWDIGSLTLDTTGGCVANASPYGDGCACDNGSSEVDTDDNNEVDACLKTIWVDDGDTGEPYYNFYTNADCTDASTGKLTPDTPYMFKRCEDPTTSLPFTSHPFAVNSGSGWQPSEDYDQGLKGDGSVIVTTGSSGTVGWKCTNHPIMTGEFCVGASACVFTPEDLTKLKDAVNLCIGENVTGWCPTLAGTAVPSGQGSGKYGVIGSWNVSQVTSFEELFKGKSSFNQPIGDWDTSNVTSLSRTFYSARAFNQSIGDWNTSKVTTLYYTFRTASAFNQPIGDWDTSSVSTLSYTFSFASAFNQPIGDWNTSKVTSLYQTFYYASAFNQPIGDWDTSSVSTLDWTFYSASAFNQSIGDWNTSKVTSLYQTFYSASAFNQPIGDWDTSSVSTLSYTFSLASAFNQPIGDWNTSKVTSLYQTFYSASAFNQSIGDWDISSVSTLDSTFYYASAFNQDLSSWVTTLDTSGTLFEHSAMCDEVKGGACNCAGDMRVNGVCQVSGCTDASACNYDDQATDDDDSCTLPAQYYDCSGACLVDTDYDGVCDELEVSGCMDASACNYDATATDSGSCTQPAQYYDCSGACLVDTDSDGVCDEVDPLIDSDNDGLGDSADTDFGCRTQSACNYDSSSTVNHDGSLCVFADDASCETCVGTTAQVTFDADGDGVCDDEDTCIGGDCVEDKVVVEYDGQRYEACEGATVKVLKNGNHNIWEDSEAVIEPLSTSAVTTTLLGAQKGTTRTFYCSAHPEKTFQISCCDSSRDNPATYINNQCCQCSSS